MRQTEKIVYVDNNATTKVADDALAAMRPFFSEIYGNPSSLHPSGKQAARAMEKARQQVADFLGARPGEIIFTSGGTESDNMALRGTLTAYPNKKHLITTTVEHSAILHQCRVLEKEGYRVTYLGVDSDGRLDLNRLADSIEEDTAIISVMWANNETGVVYPVEEIGEIARERGVVFHTDAVQAAGKIPIRLKKPEIDLLSLSAHKFYGPKGIGALYIRRGKRVLPLIVGGEQEKGRRGGTENIPAIVGMGAAAALVEEERAEEQLRIAKLRDWFERTLLEEVPDTHIHGADCERLAGTSNLRFEGADGEAALLMLSEKGICASSGSACSSQSIDPSHVLLAMGLDEQQARGAIRISFGRFNTDEDVNVLLEALPETVEKLRAAARR